jgi:hypothetical protein
MEIVVHCKSLEDARNQAVAMLERLGGVGGPYAEIFVAKNMGGNSPLAGARCGVVHRKPWIRLRLDFDPNKGPHYNVESDAGDYAFTFTNAIGESWENMGDEERAEVRAWMGRIGQRMRH